jgi:hypothetical protein
MADPAIGGPFETVIETPVQWGASRHHAATLAMLSSTTPIHERQISNIKCRHGLHSARRTRDED